MADSGTGGLSHVHTLLLDEEEAALLGLSKSHRFIPFALSAMVLVAGILSANSLLNNNHPEYIDGADKCLALYFFLTTALLIMGIAGPASLQSHGTYLSYLAHPGTLVIAVGLLATTLVAVLIFLSVVLLAGWAPFEMAILRPIRPLLAGCAAFILYGPTSLIKFCSATVFANPPVLVARRITKPEQPGIFRLIHEICSEISCEMPHNVVLGLDPLFWVSSITMRLVPERTDIKGFTLHIPLSLISSLSTPEVRAAIAHELHHLKSKDIVLRRRFHVTYVRTSGMIRSLCGKHSKPNWAARPIASFLYYYQVSLREGDGHLSREGEFLADRTAKIVTSGAAMAALLLKAEIYNDLWERRTLPEAKKYLLGEKRLAPRLAQFFYRVIRAELGESITMESAEECLQDHPTHSFDQHPPLRQRVQNIIDIRTFAPDMLLIGNSSYLIRDFDAIDEGLSQHYQVSIFGNCLVAPWEAAE